MNTCWRRLRFPVCVRRLAKLLLLEVLLSGSIHAEQPVERQVKGGKGGVRELISFPSPFPSGYTRNDTVWADYYQPEGKGPFPAVLVLHSLGTKKAGAEHQLCRALLKHRIASLLLQLPFHMRRRPPEVHSAAQMMASDPELTTRVFEQAFADIHAAIGWLADRHEIDAGRLAVTGVSLGAVIGATALGREPLLRCGVLLLGGADLVEIAQQSPLFFRLRRRMRANGTTAETLRTIWHDIEPLTWSNAARGKPVLMVNGAHDWVLPPESVKELQQAFSHVTVARINAGHYGGNLVKRQVFELASVYLCNVLRQEAHPMQARLRELARSPAPKVAIVVVEPGRVKPAFLVELLSFPQNRIASIDVGLTWTQALLGLSCDTFEIAGTHAMDLGIGLTWKPGGDICRYFSLALHF